MSEPRGKPEEEVPPVRPPPAGAPPVRPPPIPAPAVRPPPAGAPPAARQGAARQGAPTPAARQRAPTPAATAAPTLVPARSAVLDEAHLGDIEGALGRIRVDDDDPRRGLRRRLVTFLAIMGPGLIVMVGDNDAGGGDRKSVV